MNTLHVVFLVSAALLISGLDSAPKIWSEWESFKVTHNKMYNGQEDEISRMKIFAENLVKIAEHNFLYAMGQKSYTMKMNKFGDMTSEEFLRMLNNIPMPDRDDPRRRAVPFVMQETRDSLPEAVDWREEGAVTPVKNQGPCGSCWAFTTIGTVEGQHFLKTGKLVRLSEQFLVDCSVSNSGCHGGWMDRAYEDIMSFGGVPGAEAYPYVAWKRGCKFNKTQIEAKITGYVDLPRGDEDALKEAIALKGPVAVAIDAGHYSLQFYHGGVYDEPNCSSQSLNHGVLLVGYGKSDSGVEYWILKNSWGSFWGDKGYFKMIKNTNMCGVATAASYVTI